MTTVYLFGEGLFQKDDFWLSFNIVRDLNSDFVTSETVGFVWSPG